MRVGLVLTVWQRMAAALAEGLVTNGAESQFVYTWQRAGSYGPWQRAGPMSLDRELVPMSRTESRFLFAGQRACV